jgi:PAS domain S-box-containing protein
MLRQFKLAVRGALRATIVFLAVLNTAHGAEAPAVKRLLIISTGSRLAPGFALVDQQILQALSTIAYMRIETYAENLDLVRFSNERYQEIFAKYLNAKYADFPPDVIILVYVGSLATPGELLPKLFPGTPIIVAGFTEEDLIPKQFGDLVGGVAQRVDPRATFDLMLRLQPDLRRVVVIAGTADIDRQVARRAREAAESYKDRIETEFWDNRTMAELRAGVAELGSHTAILFARLFRDAAGQAFVSSLAAHALAQKATAPVYVMTDANLDGGAVGGAVGGAIASIEAFGKRAGELAVRVLSGTAPASLPLEISNETVPTFDWRALQRWGIPESRLPPNSVVRFRPPALWEQYRSYALGAFFLILVQGVMIIDLLLERRRRQRAQTELHESQQLVELATTAGELGLWWRDLHNGEIWANAPLRAFFGFGPDGAISFEDMLGRIHPGDRANLIALLDRAQADGVPFAGEFRILRRDGEERWVLAKGRTIAGAADGHKGRRMGVVLDITERKRAEEALKNERTFLRQVIDIDPNLIFAKDREGRFTLANRAVANTYGTTVEKLIGKTDADFNAHPDEVEGFRRVDLEVIETLRERFIPEEHITDAQGNVRWLQTVKRPIIERDGTATQILGASSDITLRKKTELELQEQRAELAHVARVSMMGELAASLAHELNQPLTAILSNAQAALRFLSSKPGNIEEVREILHDIVKDNTRAGEVIRRMRALVKKEGLEFASHDLATLLRDVVALVHSDAILHGVRISLKIEKNLPPVQGDRVQLQQVVLNILLNAFDAMKESPAGGREVQLSAERDSRNFIKVAISDRGIGLTGDKLAKIFDPFYTTKRDGLGMGLSICRSIIAAHGGRLWAENNCDAGATFYFTLPILRQEPAENPSLQVVPGQGG